MHTYRITRTFATDITFEDEADELPDVIAHELAVTIPAEMMDEVELVIEPLSTH